jgi:hypothetical protein
LSITSQLIQVPGAYILAFYQIFNHQLLVGMTAVIAGLEQTILLLLCLFYEFRIWRANRKTKMEQSEKQGLLSGADSISGDSYSGVAPQNFGHITINSSDQQEPFGQLNSTMPRDPSLILT